MKPAKSTPFRYSFAMFHIAGTQSLFFGRRVLLTNHYKQVCGRNEAENVELYVTVRFHDHCMIWYCVKGLSVQCDGGGGI